MSVYKEQLQSLYSQYKDEVQPMGMITAHDVAAWAYHKGLMKPRIIDIISNMADELAKAWREEYKTDPTGNRYRTKHAVVKTEGDKQLTFWVDMATTTRSNMVLAFAQRRRQIVGDCVHLKNDVDAYNFNFNTGRPIQIPFDFTRDIREAQRINKPRAA
jgi:hypothetical protein